MLITIAAAALKPHVPVACEIESIVNYILAGTSTSIDGYKPTTHQLSGGGNSLLGGGKSERIGAPFTVN
jgi:hypothetical protein